MVPIKAWLSEARRFCLTTGRPLVTLSYAQSLDGCISVRRDVRTPISGPESMVMTHQLRAAHDAILVGIGTALADDPRLTARLVEGDNPQPIVLDSRLRLPPDARLLQGDRPLWIATAQTSSSPGDEQHTRQQNAARLLAQGAHLLPLPVDQQGRLSLGTLLSCLAEKGITSLMVEGGAQVITSFLMHNLVDQVVLTIAPIILGGLAAVERYPDLPTGAADKPSAPTQIIARLREMGYDRAGKDLIVWGKLG